MLKNNDKLVKIIDKITFFFEEKIKKKIINFINKILQERISIMVIPHGNEKIHNIHISLMSLIFLALLVVFLAIISISAYGKYKEIAQKIQEMRNLYGDNYEKVYQIQKIISQIENHSENMYNKLLRSEYRIIIPEIVSTSFMVNYKSSLKKSYEFLDKNLEETKELQGNTKYLKPIYISHALAEFYKNNSKVLEDIGNSLDTLRFRSTIPNGRPVELNHIHDTSQFGLRLDPISQTSFEFHSGMDMAGALDEPIFATAEGQVEKAGYDPGYGYFVQIRHPSSYITIYAHLNKVLVEVDDYVNKKQLIGRMGSTGRVTGIHLHYEVVLPDGQKVNPVYFVCLDDIVSELCKKNNRNDL